MVVIKVRMLASVGKVVVVDSLAEFLGQMVVVKVATSLTSILSY